MSWDGKLFASEHTIAILQESCFLISIGNHKVCSLAVAASSDVSTLSKAEQQLRASQHGESTSGTHVRREGGPSLVPFTTFLPHGSLLSSTPPIEVTQTTSSLDQPQYWSLVLPKPQAISEVHYPQRNLFLGGRPIKALRRVLFRKFQ